MSKQTLDITAFAGQPWLIEPEAGALLLARLVQGNLVLQMDEGEDPIHYASPDWVWYPAAQVEGSTVVLTISGIIYDGYANYLCSKLDLIYADKNLSSMVVKMNSPGGAANAAYKIADKLAQAPFPTTGYVDYGMAASSGLLICCACDQTFASRPSDLVGSIGTYIPYQNWDKYFEKLGIQAKDIYAKQSTEKNQESRQAADGNFKLLQQMADDAAAQFIDFVKARRPGIDASTNDPFKGKIFSATDALSIGLIDGIGDLKAAVKALKSVETVQNTTPRTTMIFGYVKATALLALASAMITEDSMKAANEELTAMGVKGAQLISQADFDALVNAANAAPDANALNTANDKITELTNQLTTVTNERNSFEADAKKYGAMNAAEKTQVQGKGETPPDAGDTEVDASEKLIAGLAHNKALEGSWLMNLGQETK